MKLRALATVVWMLRWDLLAVIAVAGLMMMLSSRLPFQSVAQIVPLMGVVVSIFIGFRNTSAYNRWLAARNVWAALQSNSRALSNALIAVETPGESIADTADRIRRRQARYLWQLGAELRGLPVPADVVALTPEDPPVANAGELLGLQAKDIHAMVSTDGVDRQGRSVLVNLNTAVAVAAGNLEPPHRQPIPLPYEVFIRAVAWFFAFMVCTRLDSAGHTNWVGVGVGVAVMILFVVAERFGHFISEPMSTTPFGLPVDRFCAEATADLLGPDHPRARS